jgi:hypothetical protein
MRRRGVALLLVLLTLLVTAAMAAGVLAVTTGQTRTAGDVQRAFRITEAAERGHLLAALGWSPESSLTTPIGRSIGPLVTAYADSTTSSVWITRLSPGSFWVTSLAHGPALGAALPIERRVGALYSLHLPEIRLTAAVSVGDSLLVRDAAAVSGYDSAPPGWSGVCTSSAATVAALAAPDTSRVCDGACGSSGTRLTGTPLKQLDSTAAPAVQIGRFGPVTWTSLAAHATHVFPGAAIVTPAPRLTGLACDTAAAGNWGDPSRTTACRNRFAIVHALGDLIIDGGSGQGIILGEGDVELRNDASFAGLILTRDDLLALTGANRVWGAVVAADMRRANGDLSVIADATAVTYSSCSVEMALLGAAQMRRASQRGWIPIH